VCARCGEELRRRNEERPGNFKKRKSCGRRCGGLIGALSPLVPSRRATAAKRCRCGGLVQRREEESLRDFNRRKSCDRRCGAAGRRKTVEVLGVELTIQEAADLVGINCSSMHSRIYDGKSLLAPRRLVRT
jgi:hypothetical protein